MDPKNVVVVGAAFGAALSIQLAAIQFSTNVALLSISRSRTEEPPQLNEEGLTAEEEARRRLLQRRLQGIRRREERARNRVQPYRIPLPYTRFQFNLALWDDAWIKQRTRMTREEIFTILPYLRLEEITWSSRYNPSIEKAFVILLYLLSWPLRLCDIMEQLGCSRSQLSSIFNDICLHLWRTFKQILLWNHHRLTLRELQEYRDAITQHSGGDRVWGWIDGTIIKIARPSEDQRASYSGYKKAHGFKFQAIMTPDGLISSLFGPVVAKQGDWRLWHQSNIEELILRLFRQNRVSEEQYLFIYGDPAYTGSRVCIGAYRAPPQGRLTAQQALFNAEMSSDRISVEHGFGNVQNLWMRNAFSHSLRSISSPVDSYYATSVLLANIRTCMTGNLVTQRFELIPPSLEEYFAVNG